MPLVDEYSNIHQYEKSLCSGSEEVFLQHVRKNLSFFKELRKTKEELQKGKQRNSDLQMEKSRLKVKLKNLRFVLIDEIQKTKSVEEEKALLIETVMAKLDKSACRVPDESRMLDCDNSSDETELPLIPRK